MAFDANNDLYVARVLGGGLSKIDPETGAIFEELGSDDSVFYPDDVDIGPDGTLYWTEIILGTVFSRPPGGPSAPLLPIGDVPSANPLKITDDGKHLFFAQCYAEGGNSLFELDLQTNNTKVILENVPGCASNSMDIFEGELYSPRPFEGRVVKINVASTTLISSENEETIPITEKSYSDQAEVVDVATNMGYPAAVKFNSKGELFAVTQDPGSVVRIHLNGPNTDNNTELIAKLPIGWVDNLAFDKDDRLYVSSYTDATVLEILQDGSNRTVVRGVLSVPMGLAALADKLYTVHIGVLNGFDQETGSKEIAVRSVFGVGPLLGPTNVAAWGGNLVLLSFFFNTLAVWDPESNAEVLSTTFSAPVDALPFREGLLVTDLTGNIVRASGPQLQNRTVIASLPGAGFLAGDEDENIFVSNFANGEVVKIMSNGELIDPPVAVSAGHALPEGIALLPSGTKLLVVSGESESLQEVDLQTNDTRTIASHLGFAPSTTYPAMPPFSLPNKVVVDESGAIYVNSDKANVIYKIEAAEGEDDRRASRAIPPPFTTCLVFAVSLFAFS